MYSYLKGAITFRNPTYIIVETGGVGYHLNVSLNTYSKVEKLNAVKIFTYLHVKEDALTLFGFAEEEERVLFIHLISVSGIGPNTARIVLSSMTPEEVKSAIISENVVAFKKVKGVGPKTAKRLILDLKDKLIKESGDVPFTVVYKDNTIRDEALSALLALGFNKGQVIKSINKVLQDNPGTMKVEELIKLSLKQLSG